MAWILVPLLHSFPFFFFCFCPPGDSWGRSWQPVSQYADLFCWCPTLSVRRIIQHTLINESNQFHIAKGAGSNFLTVFKNCHCRIIPMPHHPPWVTFITKQGWMPSEMIQVRANVAHVLSPGKLRNFLRMKLREQGEPGSCSVPSLADNKASVSKQ